MTKSKLKNPEVAYFSAEYGIDSAMPIYAGGLGVLSGDTVKEAADRDYPFVAVGLLYRGCGARQFVDSGGMQHEDDVEYSPEDFGYEQVMTEDLEQPLFVRVRLSVLDVWAKAWRKRIGSDVDLYLLDTDTEQNDDNERGVACALYDGGDDFLLKQQMVLGIGGVKLLDAIGIKPRLYHVNEGRPAFLYWQLIRRSMKSNDLSYGEASDSARNKIVYTNHTLVKAGNNAYATDLLKKYGEYYAQKMGIDVMELLSPGIDQLSGAFSMTQFALNTSKRASAVSNVHFDLSKNLWPHYHWENITNGVHFPTWQHSSFSDISSMTDSELWALHLERKTELAQFVGASTGYTYDPNRLVVVWARRIASYKRPDALFSDIERLKTIVSNSNRPVQILLSGKAHAADTEAKQMLKGIIGHMQNELVGHAIYIPSYSMDVAKPLVMGADIWLNTPIYGKEASGTSGMKAAANGVLQLTVEDGWSAEVDWHSMGYTLESDPLPATLYLRLEDDIVPTFYDRNKEGVPHLWVARMRRTINMIERFSTRRMFDEYVEKLYR